MEAPTPATPTFMGIPVELRVQIYRYILAPSITCICNRVWTAILATNSQVHKEAVSILYTNWTPRLRLPDLYDGGIEFNQRRHALWIAEQVSLLLLTPDVQHSIPTIIPPSRWLGDTRFTRHEAKATLFSLAFRCRDAVRTHLPSAKTVKLHVDYLVDEPMLDFEMLLHFFAALGFTNCIVEVHQPRDTSLYGEFQQWVSTLRLKTQNFHSLEDDFDYKIAVAVREFARR